MRAILLATATVATRSSGPEKRVPRRNKWIVSRLFVQHSLLLAGEDVSKGFVMGTIREPADLDVRDPNGYSELDRLRKTTRWKRIRGLVIAEQPDCLCGAKAKEVGHIVPAQIAIAEYQAAGLARFDPRIGYFIRANLRPLCLSCLQKKTIRDKRHTGPWPSVIAMERARPKRFDAFNAIGGDLRGG
jgi:5-methylcytosine-specific restriction endonuclease McrA